MSEFATLKAEKRTQTGKGVARRLRMAGKTPAVFYNAGGQSIPLQVSEKEVTRLFESGGRTTIFNVEIDGASHPALLWDLDFFPTKNRIQHVDIFGVDLKKEIKVKVPLVFTGVAKGTKLGGKTETYRESIEVSCLPLSLPQSIEVDITDMGLNTTYRVSDLKMPEGVRPEAKTDFVVISVVAKGAAGEGEEEAGA